MDTTTALSTLVEASEVMSREAQRTQALGRQTYGRKFDAARARHLNACMWLQANNRLTWGIITNDRTVSAKAARELLDRMNAPAFVAVA